MIYAAHAEHKPPYDSSTCTALHKHMKLSRRCYEQLIPAATKSAIPYSCITLNSHSYHLHHSNTACFSVIRTMHTAQIQPAFQSFVLSAPLKSVNRLSYITQIRVMQHTIQSYLTPTSLESVIRSS